MNVMSLPIIRVSGTPRERGIKLGTEARELIRQNCEYYFRSWEKYGGLKKNSVYQLMSKFISNVKSWNRAIYEEAEGIAEGAQLDLEEVFAINARYELVISRMGKPQKVEGENCTAIAATNEATENGHTIHGQNWDYRHLEGCIILEEEQGRGEPSFAGITEAGRMGVLGFNSAGIGLTVNGLVSDHDHADDGIPFWLLVRAANGAPTLESGLSAVSQAHRSVSGSIMLAHEQGFSIDVEFTPDEVGVMFPENGMIAHTNHFIELRHKVKDLFKSSVPDTFIRLYAVQKQLARKSGTLTVQDFKEVFSNHYGYPHSVCRHSDPSVQPDQSFETISSLIYDLNERTLFYSIGNPCKHGHLTLKFESLSSAYNEEVKELTKRKVSDK